MSRNLGEVQGSEKINKKEVIKDIELHFDNYINSNKYLKNIFFLEKLDIFTLPSFEISNLTRSVFIVIFLSFISIGIENRNKDIQEENLRLSLIEEEKNVSNFLLQVKNKNYEEALEESRYINRDKFDREVFTALSNYEKNKLFDKAIYRYNEEYQKVKKSFVKGDQMKKSLSSLISYSILAENFASTNNQKKLANKKYLLASYLEPAGSSNEAVDLCKTRIKAIYGSVDIDDSILLRAAANAVVGEIVGNENNENYTLIAWPTYITGKNSYGMEIRNQVRCEVKFYKVKEEGMSGFKVNPKVTKIVVGNKIYRY